MSRVYCVECHKLGLIACVVRRNFARDCVAGLANGKRAKAAAIIS